MDTQWPAYIWATPENWGSTTVYATDEAMDEQIESLRQAGDDWETISFSECTRWNAVEGQPGVYEEAHTRYPELTRAIFEDLGDGYYEMSGHPGDDN